MRPETENLMIWLVWKICKQADKFGADRDKMIKDFAVTLLKLSIEGTFKDFSLK